jgi:two-component system chemotaxis response regulator CheB
VIRVLVVDDSPVARELMVRILGSDPDLQVVATACDGKEALDAVLRHGPDVVTMDVHMPVMEGYEATLLIMRTRPTPIVIVTASPAAGEAASAFRAEEAGALAVVRRPAGPGHADFEAEAMRLIETVKLMSEVKVVMRARPAAAAAAAVAGARPAPLPADVEIVAAGASTGGPVVLRTILSLLPRDFPVPVLIVQHMSPGFIHGLAEWLAGSTSLTVGVAADGERLLPGRVYLAPDGAHMGVAQGGRIALSGDDPENGMRPSVSHLFRSAARAAGRKALGVLLTGMGRDGVEELASMRKAGSVTIAQDRESSVVFGMAGEAIKIDAATLVLGPEAIASVLAGLARKEGS